MTAYTSAADVNKIIRKVLKRTYPGVKFSVTKSRGSAINVSWTDGPLQCDVDDLLQFARGGDFDGMTDCMNYRAATGALKVDNDIVSEEIARFFGDWGAEFRPLNDFVFTHRDYSAAALDAAARTIETAGFTAPRTDNGGFQRGDLGEVQTAAYGMGLHCQASSVFTWVGLATAVASQVDYTASPVA